MRTIDEIKSGIESDFMNNETAASAYGFAVGDSFSGHFSKVSVESVLFYIFAAAAWVLEKLFDSFRDEVEIRIENIKPHRPLWYRNKVLDFMKGLELIPDTDLYDTSGMTEGDIAAAHVVKHAVAAESEDESVLTIKVAGESGGQRCKLDDATQTQLSAYLAEIKDAGVRISLVNQNPDIFNCEVEVYYNPMLLPENVQTACEAAIKSYVENLPFNGEYTNMALVDALQAVEGVKIVEFKEATTNAPDGAAVPINGCVIPVAGYFTTGTVKIKMVAHNG